MYVYMCLCVCTRVIHVVYTRMCGTYGMWYM